MITGATRLEMGGLMQVGNNLLAPVGSTVTFNSISYSKNDFSAAVQVAIWSVEYQSSGAFSYDTNGFGAGFGALVTNLEAYASTHGADWLLLDGYNQGNQSLGTLPVPGPLAGAGVPGMALFAFGLAWYRRRRGHSIAIPRGQAS